MKTKQFKLLISIAILILSCSNNQSQKEFDRLNIWEEIQRAVKEKNINYLLENSKDTLECIECNDGENWILKEEFFSKHFDQIVQRHKKEYIIHSEKYEGEKGFDKRYHINYSYEGKGEKYNIIYKIIEGEKGIQFQGVFGVP